MTIYVHIPFCISKCHYCAFTSFSNSEKIFDNYLFAILNEIDEKSSLYNKESVSSIYFGGGTPTVFGDSRCVKILDKLKEKFVLESNAEITIEGNPKTFNLDNLKNLKQAGFNRFSVGIQSFSDLELSSVNRAHTAKEGQEGLENIRKVFDNFSLDLMIGLKNQTFETFKKSIEKALNFEPKHISCYMLKVEEGTQLFLDLKSGNFKEMDEDEQIKCYEFLVKKLKENGYYHYETSNFALKSYESRHNLSYWDMTNYIGFGLSAHSLFDGRRFFNTSNLNEYLLSPENEILEEVLNKTEQMQEYAMLKFRTNEGINFSHFQSKYNTSFQAQFKEAIEKSSQYLDITEKNIRIKDKHKSVANSIIVNFI